MAIRQLPVQSFSLVLFVLLAPVFTAGRLADAFAGSAHVQAAVDGLRAGGPAGARSAALPVALPGALPVRLAASRGGAAPASAAGSRGVRAGTVASLEVFVVAERPDRAPGPLAAGGLAPAVGTAEPCPDREGWPSDARGTACEVRTYALAARDRWDVDAGANGGIRVEAWDRPDAELRAVVRADAPTETAARRLVAGVRVETDGPVRAAVPQTGPGEAVTVSYELRVPRRADLDLAAVNGGIEIEGVAGDVAFRTRNGGVRLAGVGGDVRGATRNGGLSVDLAGRTWDGRGLDVETANGGVELGVPEGYSAELEAGTTNGRFRVDLPGVGAGPRDRALGGRLTTTLGRGGPRVRVVTANGGVTVSQN